MAVTANKYDLESERIVSTEGIELAKSFGLFFETSSEDWNQCR